MPLDDLQRAIFTIEEQDDELVTATRDSPVNREIQRAPLNKGFKHLNIKVYEGKGDP